MKLDHEKIQNQELEEWFFTARKNVSTVEVKLKGIGSQSFAEEAKVMALLKGILFAVDVFTLITKLLDIVP